MLDETPPLGTLMDLGLPSTKEHIKNKSGSIDNHKDTRDNQELVRAE